MICRSSSNLSHAGMVTAADMVNLHHQMRQEVADVIQQFHNGLNEIVNCKLDSIATAQQSVRANPA